MLLDEQLRDRSMANTAAYFVINELTSVAALALAVWLHRHRHAPTIATAVG